MAGEDTGRTATLRETGTGATAVPRLEELGKGRGTPQKQQMPFARHTSIHIILGTGASGTDTQGAIDELLTAFLAWKRTKAVEHYRIKELRFEFVTEDKLVLYIIYSE